MKRMLLSLIVLSLAGVSMADTLAVTDPTPATTDPTLSTTDPSLTTSMPIAGADATNPVDYSSPVPATDAAGESTPVTITVVLEFGSGFAGLKIDKGSMFNALFSGGTLSNDARTTDLSGQVIDNNGKVRVSVTLNMPVNTKPSDCTIRAWPTATVGNRTYAGSDDTNLADIQTAGSIDSVTMKWTGK